jgi:predicted ATPase/DNA-binding SARP family transcriptional activator
MLSVGQPVPVETLIDRVWGETFPDQVRNTLYSYIARLRAILRSHIPGSSQDPPLRRITGGYVLDLPAAVIDCQRFRYLVDQARDRDTGDHQRRLLLRDALRQWRGRPLDGLTSDWAERVRHEFEQYRINAAAEWSDLELSMGEHGLVVDQLNTLLSEYPFAENLVGQLMRGLHAAGRTAEALERYATTRQQTVSELGAEPSSALRKIHQEILEATSAGPPPEAPSRRADRPLWRGLRPYLTRLIGRDDERVRLAGQLERRRLVTVTGVGGCGKTALALDVAHAVTRTRGMPVTAVPLATVTSAGQVAHTLRALLGGTDDGEDPFVTVERILGAGPALLVLDNCEHLAAETAELVLWLLGRCPALVVLATSRQPLSVSGEVLFTLEPLAVPARDGPADLTNPAVQLFVERLRNSAPTVPVTGEDTEHIAEICRRLDGLPLALELVAARARTFTLADLADRLGRNMTLLFRTSATGEPRHRTLDATLDWSFQLLSEHQRRLFARLAVFADGFGARDVEEVCGFAPLDEDQSAAILAALVDRCLVVPYDHEGTRRYRLLEIVRSFAARQQTDFAEQPLVASRYLDRWHTRVRVIDQLPRYHQRTAALRAIEVDAANLRQCLEYGFQSGRSLDSADIIARVFEFWLIHAGYLAEGRSWLDRALSVPELGERVEVHGLLCFHRALLARFVEDQLGALRLIQQVVGMLREHRPREFLEASAAVLNGKLAVLDPSALNDVAATVEMARHSDEHDDVCTVTNAAGVVLNGWGHYDQALQLSHEYDRRGVDLGASSWAAVLTVRIDSMLGRADLSSAAELVGQLVALLGDVVHAAEHDSPRRVIALFHLASGHVQEARRFLDDARTSLRATYPPLAARLVYLQILLAEAQRRCGQPLLARRTLSGGLTAATRHSQFRLAFTGVLGAALIATDLGENTAGQELTLRWDTLRRELGLPVPTGFTDAAARTLALDPAPPTDLNATWKPDALRACIATARTWCERETPGERQVDQPAR